jgi:hypothetical protein
VTSFWQDRGDGHFWLWETTLGPEAIERLATARCLTLTQVKIPRDFYAGLPRLTEVEIDGGSATDVVAVRRARRLKRLAILRAPTLTTLDWLTDLPFLESLSLFSVPKIESIPSLAGLPRLRFVQLGNMVRLRDLSGVAQAPVLEELRLTQRLAVTAESMKPFVGHPTLARFGWWWDEGVPASRAKAALDALPLPRPDWQAGDIGANMTSTDTD